MSNNIDERVVEMRFDNKQFESNVSTTMSTLDKLKQKLHLTGATKGLEDVNAAAKKVDMTSLGESAHTVGLKFNAMHTMADQALRNITTKVQNTAERIVSALTIDPVKTGFSEYETKINSIQTIMSNTASKGTTMEDVTRVIGELNTYADKTIYNFAEMTRNIGTFTAAGVGLEDSAKAIQGIANLAAASGSTSQQASTAMYQLSQALSTGTVRLMDWNSVVNAGMGGEKFQEALKATAKEHGVAVDDIIAKNGSFRDSLQDGWLSADILNETLRKFTVKGAKEYAQSMVESGKYTQEQADALIKEAQAMEDAATKVKTFTQLWDTLKESAQSGWSQTWEILVGDFEEAKELLTQVSDVIGGMIGASADARNSMLEDWKIMGGRAELIEAIKNAFEGVMSIVKPIKEAFREIFPPMTAEQLLKFTTGLKDLTAKLKLSRTTSDNLKRTFAGLFATVKTVVTIFSSLFKAVASLFGGVGSLGGGILGITASFGDWLVEINRVIQSAGIFNAIFMGAANVIKMVISGITKFVKFIGKKLRFPALESLGNFLGNIVDGMGGVSDAAGGMRDTVGDAFSAMGAVIKNSILYKVFDTIRSAISSVLSVVKKLFGTIGNRLKKLDFHGIMDIIDAISTGAIWIYFAKFMKGLAEIVEIAPDFKDSILGIFDSVGETLGAFQKKLKAEALMKVATAIAILAAAIVVLTLVDQDKLKTALAAITTMFVELMGVMALLSKVSDPATSMGSIGRAMVAMSIAMLIMAKAAQTFIGMSWEEIGKAVAALGGMSLVMALLIKVLPGVKVASDETRNVAPRLVSMGIAMIAFGTAMLLFAEAVDQFAAMDWVELGKAGIALVALVGALAILIKAMGGVKVISKDTKAVNPHLISMGVTMIAFGAAMLLFAEAVSKFTSMSWNELVKAGAALAAFTLVMLLLTKVFSDGKVTTVEKKLKVISPSLVGTGLAMIAFGAAMNLFAAAVKDFAAMNWGELAKSGVALVALVGAVVALGFALKLVPKTTILSAAGLVVAAGALIILVGALKLVSMLKPTEIARGLIAILGALTALAVGLTLMLVALPGALALAVAAKHLIVLAGALAIFGALPAAAIAKALGVILVALVVLGVGLTAMLVALPGALALPVVAVGLILLATALGVLSKIPLTGVAKSILILTMSLIALSVGLWAIEDTKMGSLALMLAAAGVMAIAAALQMVSTLPADAIAKGLGVIAVSLAALGVALLAMKATTKGSTAILMAAAGIVIMGFALQLVSTLDWETVAKGLAVVAVSLAALGVALLAMKGGVKSAIALPLIAVGIAALAIALQMVAKLDMQTVAVGLGVVAVALGALGVALLGMKMTAKSALALPVIALGIIALAIALQFVGGLDIASIAMGLGTIAVALGALGVALLAMRLDAKGIVTLIAVTAAIVILANMMKSLGSMSWEEIGKSVASVGSVIATLIVVMAAAKVAGSIGAGALKGIAMLGLIAAELGVVFAALGLIAQIPHIDKLIAAGGGFLEAIGLAIGRFVGGIVGGVAAGVTSALPHIGQNLTDFMTNAQGFITGASSVNEAVLNGATNLAKIILILTAASLLDGIASFFTGKSSISEFGKELIPFGIAMTEFSSIVAGKIDENAVNAAANAGKIMAEMANTIPNSGGVVGFFAGENDIDTFGAKLLPFGVAITEFSQIVAGKIDENAVTSAANAGKTMAEMAKTIPNTGGVVGFFAGENDMGAFGKQLISFGSAITLFSTTVSGKIDAEAVTSASNAGKTMSEMAKTIPNSGGVVGFFTGDNDMDTFGSQLVKFGSSMVIFSKTVAGKIDAEAVTAAANAGKTMAELSKSLPKTGGLKAFFSGDQDLDDFGDDLKGLGKGIAKFSKEVKGISVNAVSNAVSSLEKLGSLAKDISGVNFKSLGSFGKSLGDIGKDGINKFVKAFKDSYSKVEETGETMITKLINGVKAKSNKFSQAFTTVVKDAVEDVRGYQDNFYNAGSHLVAGFANGISANSYKASAKAAAMAKAAKQAAEDELGIKSPSRVFYGIGDYAGQGFINALIDYETKSYAAGADVADSARNGLRDTIRKIGVALNSDMDMQPTIRPVLDLSSVRSGAHTISDMLGAGSSIGVMARVGAISSSMNRTNQNGGNDDVVNAISKLRKDISGMKSETYQINGLTYDDDTAVNEAFKTIARAAKMGRRV